MNSLINDNFIRQIQQISKKEPKISVVYLFGSQQKGYAAKKSDLDLAFVVKDHRTFSLDTLYKLLLPIKFPHEPDISVVDKNSSLLFLYEIISGGKRIYAKDDEAADSFEAYVLDVYYDTKHLRNIYRNYLKESLEKGTYGYKT